MMIIGFILFSLPGILSASYFTVLKGYPKIPKVGQIVASSEEECLSKSLDEFANKSGASVAAFLHNSSLCKAFSLPIIDVIYLFAHFNIDSILEEKKSNEHQWVTLVPKKCFPSILWPLSKETKGKNLGAGGQTLDLSIEKNCDFTTIVKEVGSFCRIRESAEAVSAPIVLSNGHRIIDFSKDFTFALWIKSYATSHYQKQLIIGSYPIYACRLVFYPSDHVNQMTLALSDKGEEMDTTTIIESRDKYNWRYLAVTYKAPNQIMFFRNAEEWPILHKRMPKNPKVIPATHIQMFQGHGGLNTYGSLAFVGILQKAVSQEELHDMMMGY